MGFSETYQIPFFREILKGENSFNLAFVVTVFVHSWWRRIFFIYHLGRTFSHALYEQQDCAIEKLASPFELGEFDRFPVCDYFTRSLFFVLLFSRFSHIHTFLHIHRIARHGIRKTSPRPVLSSIRSLHTTTDASAGIRLLSGADAEQSHWRQHYSQL